MSQVLLPQSKLAKNADIVCDHAFPVNDLFPSLLPPPHPPPPKKKKKKERKKRKA